MSESLKCIIDDLEAKQLTRLSDLRGYAVCMQETLSKLIKKIDDQGVAGYYSVNHDSLSQIRRLHGICMELCYTRSWKQQLEKELQSITDV